LHESFLTAGGDAISLSSMFETRRMGRGFLPFRIVDRARAAARGIDECIPTHHDHGGIAKPPSSIDVVAVHTRDFVLGRMPAGTQVNRTAWGNANWKRGFDIPSVLAIALWLAGPALGAKAAFDAAQRLTSEANRDVQATEASPAHAEGERVPNEKLVELDPIGGAEIAEALKLLRDLGFYAGDISEEIDSETRQAIVDFQTANLASHVADGVLGPQTLAALRECGANGRCRRAAGSQGPTQDNTNAARVRQGAVTYRLVARVEPHPQRLRELPAGEFRYEVRSAIATKEACDRLLDELEAGGEFGADNLRCQRE
jgi:hypothetical protein